MENKSSKPRKHLEIGTILFNSDEKTFSRFLQSISQNIRDCSVKGIDISLRIKWNSPPTFDLQQIRGLSEISNVMEQGYYNTGFGRAHNNMMVNAFEQGADYYICINPDGFLDIDAVATLVEFYENLETKGIVEAIQFPREHPKQYNPFTFETAWCSGACLFIAREIHDQIGGFDDNIFMYCEDIDLSWRTKEAGLKCYLCANAIFFHDVRESKSELVRKMMLDSARYIAIKWQNKDFRASIENILLLNNFYKSVSDMPLYDGLTKHNMDPKNQEWRHMLSFSQTRW